MVAKIITGKSIKGALNYNEKKVSEAKAALLSLIGFPSEQLSFSEKLFRFERLTGQNTRTKVNAVHISLNFDSCKNPDKETLLAIADTYMDNIGFAGQPYLLYQHFDAAHPHLHIVTTNIKDGGDRISLHHLGMDKSEKARKEIEKMFNLIPAFGREKSQGAILKPVLEKVIYGKSETKAAISNVVRAVAKEYKFTSLAEFNAILGEFNVTAYRGKEDSRMFEKKGLSYFVLDAKGNKTGVPIKASSIYSKPTFIYLEKQFERNKNERLRFKDAMKSTIDTVLQSRFIPNKETFKTELAKRHIAVVFRQSEAMVFGMTFIDHHNKTVFNGSDLGKEYSAKNMMERIGIGSLQQQKERKENQVFVEKTLQETDYTKGVPHAIASFYAQGLRARTVSGELENTKYALGHYQTKAHNYLPAGKKFDAWFRVNNITPFVINNINREAENYLQKTDTASFTSELQQHLSNYIKDLLAAMPDTPAPASNIQPRKKRKRKPNW